MNTDPITAIGSVAETCWGDEQRSHRDPEAPCTMCEREAVDTGTMQFLCDVCREKLASYDTEHADLRASAIRALEMFRRMDALDAPAVLVEAQAKLIEQHLIQYIPATLIARRDIENEIALWRGRALVGKAG